MSREMEKIEQESGPWALTPKPRMQPGLSAEMMMNNVKQSIYKNIFSAYFRAETEKNKQKKTKS